jgi:hypothetical protein
MKFNVSFKLIKDEVSTPKFEVVETDSHDIEAIPNILKKKYPEYDIHIKSSRQYQYGGSELL